MRHYRRITLNSISTICIASIFSVSLADVEFASDITCNSYSSKHIHFRTITFIAILLV